MKKVQVNLAEGRGHETIENACMVGIMRNGELVVRDESDNEVAAFASGQWVSAYRTDVVVKQS